MRIPANTIEFFFPSLRCRGASPYIYLTFDDGPSSHTPLILDILQSYKIPATFFLVGAHVKQYPDSVQEIVQNQHAIGNHSYTHSVLLCKNKSKVLQELRNTNDEITNITGQPVRLFRPPYGYFSPSILRIAHSLKMRTFLWSFDTRDFLHTMQSLSKIKLNKIRNGDIILCHDNEQSAPVVASILERIIKHCIEQHYTFSTLQYDI